jgi:hypothetical protein
MNVFDALTRWFEPAHFRFASSIEMRRHLSAAGFRHVTVKRPGWVLMLTQGTVGG